MKIPAALLLSLPAISLAQQIAIGEYALPAAPLGYDNCGIAKGPDGALWFAWGAINSIGRITTAGAISAYPVASAPYGITLGPDGAFWFTELNLDAIGRMTTDGMVTQFPLTSYNSSPYCITTGPDGALWFTEFDSNKIGRITTAGVVTEYSIATPFSSPYGITAGPANSLWFTEFYGNKVGVVGTSGGTPTDWLVPGAEQVNSIALGPDGALWFTAVADFIGRIATTGEITEYPLPKGDGIGAGGITAGPDGALWFTAYQAIGRVTTAGVVTEYPIPGAPGAYIQPEAIVTGPDSELWFTDNFGKIGEAVFVTADLTAAPAIGHFRSTLNFSGSGYAPNEGVRIYGRGVGSAVLAFAVADSAGSFTATAQAPPSPYGPRIFLGNGQQSGKLGAASFSMTANVALQPDAGAVGSSVTAKGYGFAALEQVEIYWNNPRTLLGTVTADVDGTIDGSAALTFMVPSGAAAGKNGVFGLGTLTKAVGSVSFTVQ